MNAIVQPALDGSVPSAKKTATRQRAEDYALWVEIVRPVFENVARTGRRFTSWEIADEHKLPDPPFPQSQWGRLVGLLRDEGLIEAVGWANSDRPGDHGSAVKVWRGTAAARRAAA
ncbi:hypothetical protein [Streptomyces vietnamensis]|uniref:hypothetical protein n=1 Tax=Streptomyces vietnamensis TaxID=362257 RepID=UPI0034209387